MTRSAATTRLPAPALLAVSAWALLSPGAFAQDVEMLGRRYGTPVPAAYYEVLARDPDAFQFSRGRPERVRQRMQAQAAALRGGQAMVLGPRDGPVQGTFTIPVLLGLYSDSPEAQRFDADDMSGDWFGEAGATVRTYYEEVSGGKVSLRGDIMPWTKSAESLHSSRWVTNGSSGLGLRTPLWIDGVLRATTGVEWGLYDNDGPDGVPNSGDDDGFVDALAVVHPMEGAECRSSGSEDRMWSHKWSISVAFGGQPYTTDVPAANGGFIRIDDYFIVGQLACGGVGLNDIGVIAHEAGHAFGLPDLYDTRNNGPRHNGAGNWDLMATGSWGCDDGSPELPCHMGAWSRVMLGWADVVDVPSGTDPGAVRLPPVQTSGTVYRIESGDGSGEYFLLENRQAVGFDQNLDAEGLLIWQVDPAAVAVRWPFNRVNADNHMGVWLRQADGFNELGSPNGNRGDSGDPFPFGVSGAFHAGSRPGALSFRGTAMGATLVDIRRDGGDITFRLRNRFSRVMLRTDGAEGGADLFRIDGTGRPGGEVSFESAPFQKHTIEAAAGVPLAPGVRTGFLGWTGQPELARSLNLTTPMEDVTLEARYGGRQVRLGMEVTGGAHGVAPGSFSTVPSSSDLWFPEGSDVTIQARPVTGFDFLGWSGVLAGEPNPASVVMSEPRDAGAAFDLIYNAPDASVQVQAATPQEVRLEALHANLPVTWEPVDGVLPQGLLLQPGGLLTGSPMETGTFQVTLQARDALGLVDRATITVEVTEPVLAASLLAAPFLLVGETLTLEQRVYLDREGNGNGQYDLGDLRAWVLRHPDLPLSAAVRALVSVSASPAAGRPDREGGS
ncbi:MAG: M6 family metalloprotease domain-containing protein [Longimicrobiales bacterium]